MKRLLDGEGTQLENGLLDALRFETPSAELTERMRAAIGLAPTALPSSPSSSTAAAPIAPLPPAASALPAAKASLSGWSAVAAGGVAAVVFIAGGVLLAQKQSAPEAPLSAHAAPTLAAPAARPADAPPTPAARPADAPPTGTPAANGNAPAVAPPGDAPLPAPHRADAPLGASAASSSVKDQMQLIDSARIAVNEHESARALKLLDQYARRFPQGVFKQEASVLRLEALEQRGETGRASDLAKKFVTEHPESPHVERVERATKQP